MRRAATPRIPPVPLNPRIPQPAPAKPAPAKPAPAKPAPAKPAKPAPAMPLGTEGDVCTSQAECASGFTCTGNVCLKQN